MGILPLPASDFCVVQNAARFESNTSRVILDFKEVLSTPPQKKTQPCEHVNTMTSSSSI